MENMRVIVRPVITLTGWGIICYLVVTLVPQIRDAALVMGILSFFLGAVSMALGFWFGQRGVRPWTGE